MTHPFDDPSAVDDPLDDPDDWDLEERDQFLAEADPAYQAPVDVLVEADD